MNKPVLPFVEIMITQACNISCLGCTNYSDLAHKGYLTWAQGREQLLPWLDRVEIPDFGIMGGEPLLNPEVRKWIQGIRQLMPNSQIRFTTNAVLLERNLDIVDILHEVGNSVFKITRHINSPDIDRAVEQIKNKFDWEPVTEYGIDRYRTSNNLRFQINTPSIFTKSYLGTYDDMRPHHSNPAAAFEICCQKTCPLLYQGWLYKCSTSGLLESTLKRFGFPNWLEWHDYVGRGIDADCSDEALTEFIANFGRPESICAQCPSSKNTESIIQHFENVQSRKVSSF